MASGVEVRCFFFRAADGLSRLSRSSRRRGLGYQAASLSQAEIDRQLKLLGFTPPARPTSIKDLERAWKKTQLGVHPDKRAAGGDEAAANEAAARVNAARDALKAHFKVHRSFSVESDAVEPTTDELVDAALGNKTLVRMKTGCLHFTAHCRCNRKRHPRRRGASCTRNRRR